VPQHRQRSVAKENHQFLLRGWFEHLEEVSFQKSQILALSIWIFSAVFTQFGAAQGFIPCVIGEFIHIEYPFLIKSGHAASTTAFENGGGTALPHLWIWLDMDLLLLEQVMHLLPVEGLLQLMHGDFTGLALPFDLLALTSALTAFSSSQPADSLLNRVSDGTPDNSDHSIKVRFWPLTMRKRLLLRLRQFSVRVAHRQFNGS
jgi:hypothetical protein